jgi:formate dehydrogenase major subunit
MGGQGDFTHTLSTCIACPVGCGIDAMTRGNMLVRVQGDWDAANGGLLCVHGRFEVVEPAQPRVTAPMMRKADGWAEVSWDEALSAVASRLKTAGPVAGLASPRATSEELTAFRELFTAAVPGSEIGLLYGEMPPALGETAALGDLSVADCIVIVNGQPLEDQKVVGYVVRRAAENGAKLIAVSDAPAALDAYAQKCLSLAEIEQAVAAASAAELPVVLYTAGLSSAVYDALRALPGKARFLPLYRGANTAAAAKLGLSERAVKGDALFVLAGDDLPAAGDGHLPAAGFTVVQAAFKSAWTDAADVVLPARVWVEKEGHVVNIEGRELPVVACVQPPAGVHADAATLSQLAERLGR